MKKKKGFTLIELLVVIAIIAMLLAILMPALGKVKKMAMRLVCGTNLKGLANAMNVYAFDYRDEYPIAGGKGNNTWTASTPGWDDPSKNWAGDDNVSVAASLYMLVREADAGVKSFICTASDQQEFVNSLGQDGTALSVVSDIVELWDFGGNPKKCQSYSYQIPYRMNFGTIFNYPADGTSAPGNAIMADKNPWFDPKLKEGAFNGDTYKEYVGLIKWDTTAQKWEYQVGNAESHDREGQNVMFADGHVEFTKRPDVGTRYDNIYTVQYDPSSPENARRKGTDKKAIGGAFAMNSEDSELVNDDQR